MDGSSKPSGEIPRSAERRAVSRAGVCLSVCSSLAPRTRWKKILSAIIAVVYRQGPSIYSPRYLLILSSKTKREIPTATTTSIKHYLVLPFPSCKLWNRLRAARSAACAANSTATATAHSTSYRTCNKSDRTVPCKVHAAAHMRAARRGHYTRMHPCTHSFLRHFERLSR